MPKTKNKKTKGLALMLSLAFLFSPFSFEGIRQNITKAEEPEIIFPDDPAEIFEITGPMNVWGKNDNIDINNTVVVREGAMLMIEPGAIIKFTKQEGKVAPFIFIEEGGLLVAEGTENEKITFTSDQAESNFSIIFSGANDQYAGSFRYVEISRAGGTYQLDAPVQAYGPIRLSRVFADEGDDVIEITDYRYPIRHRGGIVNIENCRFFDNYSADIYVDSQVVNPADLGFNGGRLVTVVGSNFENNFSGVGVASNYKCNRDTETVDECNQVLTFKNNWYGKNTGPYTINLSFEYYLTHPEEVTFDDMFGAKVIGEYKTVSNFRTKSLMADPVLIIPGIMGSDKGMMGNDLELDPLLHTYDDLVDSLEANGYEKGINLFEFPYQWRNSNVVSAQDLADKLGELQSELLVSRFDLVAHSMGGLVARQYIQSANYQWNIDQFITLGTPHRGSPKAYLMWEAGEGFFTWREAIARYHFTQEAEHAGYDDLFSYIQDKVLSVRELLPVYDYLFDVGDDEPRNYPDDYPRNYFIENLEMSGLENLGHVRWLNVVGHDDNNTITKIKITDESDEDRWEYGKSENFDNKETDRGLVLGDGDETVPIESARAENVIPIENTIEIDAVHKDLPTQAQCEVFRNLSGQSACVFHDGWNITNVLLFNVFSPIDIQVQDPEGLIIGKDFLSSTSVNQIEGAYYSGFDTENEFITIPNPKAGEYKILTQGTGEGEYEIEVALISENSEKPEGADESTVTFEGQASNGQMGASTVEVTLENEVEESTGDETAPVISISSPKDGGEYLNNQAVAVEYEMSDNISAPENIERDVRLDDEAFMEDRIELWMMMTGQHRFSVEATDEAGNSAKEEIMFDSTASFGSLTDNVEKYFQMSWITNRGVKNFLVQRLRQLEKIDYLCDWMKDHRPFFWWKKNGWEKSIRVLERTMEKDIEFLIWKIEKWETHGINPSASNLLIDSLRYIQN